MEGIYPASQDLIQWPDGTWCLRSDLDDYAYMSDDYVVISANSREYFEVFYLENM